MGWLGWSEPQALEADVNSILIAIEGKLELMYPNIKEKTKPATFAQRFHAFVKDHNTSFKARGGRK